MHVKADCACIAGRSLGNASAGRHRVCGEGASVLDCRYRTRLCQVTILEYHVGSQTIRGLMPGHQKGCAISPLELLWVSCLVYRAILGYLTIDCADVFVLMTKLVARSCILAAKE